MQKTANRILSALLVLVMVLSVLPASVFATGEAEGPFVGWSLTLGDNIGVNFYLKEEAVNYSVGVTVAGNAAATTAETKDGYYVVTANVAAAQMTDTIALSVVNGEETLHTGEYSVRQYALTILEGQYDVEVKQMVLEMLNYGAAAQTYFDYNAGNLANAGYELESAAEIPSEVPAVDVQDNLSGIALYGMSLLFRNKVAVRFYFHGSGDMNSYTFKVGDTAYTPVAKGDQYYVQVEGINPQDLDKTIDLVVSKDDATLTVSYSPMTYIIRMYNSSTSSAALKSLVQSMNGYHLEAVEYQKYLAIVPISTMSLASQYGTNGLNFNEDGTISNIYGSADANTAPGGDWAYEYTPVEAAGLKLIRDGQTYDVGIPGSGTIVKFADAGYCIKLAAWTVAGSKLPLVENDVLVIEGRYNLTSDNSVVVDFDKTYIYYDGSSVAFSAEMPTLPTTVEGSALSKHDVNGWASNGVYFKLEENAAPYDGWSIEYTPVASENLKLIRNGETYNIGIPGRGTLVKYNATDYFLKMEWNVGDYAPMQDGDILIVEGGYVNDASKVTLNISKTYIYADGSNVEFSTEMPTLPTTVEGGVMQSHPNGLSGNGLYFKLDANDAPYDGWSIEYAQTSTSGIKLIRDGVTKDIGIVDRPLIVKYSDTEYYLKLEAWTIGDYGINGSNPITTSDVLIIEGGFVNSANKVTLNIAKSYVYYDGAAWICAATLPVEVEGGNMTAHDEGWDPSDGIYASMAENSVPVDENAEVSYDGTVKLVRAGANYDVAVALIKFGATDYYLSLAGSDYLPLADGDYLVVEGAFVNNDNGYTLNVAKTYILVDGDSLVFSESEPVLETEYALTGLTNHANGWSADGIYISHDAHEATVGTDWSVRYRPVSADVIKLVRGGETFNIGQPAGDTLVVYGNTNMYFETKAWTTQGGKLPFVDGDQIIIEGKFKHEASGDILVAEKTVIYVNGSDLIFNPIVAGSLANHPNGVSGEGIYATMAENAAPYDGWNIEYTPVTADAYYVIRNGEKINIGIPGRGTLVKYSDTEYFLKINAWCTNNFAYTTDDIIVVDGFWKNDAQGVIMKMDTTYLYYDGSAWTFATELPSIVSGGVMQTHENGMSGTGIYFKLDANDAPYDGWNIEYKQISVDNIKLIRDGETISIGIVDRPLFVKYGETDYFLKLEKWTIGEYGVNGGTTPITTDDVIIIEGNFRYDNVTLKVTKSYVYYDGTAWVCSAEAPAQKNVVDVVELSSHGSGWTSGGFYFTAAANDAPYDGWSLRYKPVSADVIKVIKVDGTTTNVGNTGGETIVKYSDTEYYVEGWAIGSANLVAGNTFVIEGQFYNAANDVYIDVEKTYITLNADGSTTIITDSDKYINAGAMSAYTSNWFGDGIYFVLGSNIAPAAEDWTVRYMPKNTANIKLVRGGQTYNIANTGAESIVKIADGQYWLSLESWWWNAYAPIQDGDQLIIEGEFANSSNGFTLNIDKTYITFNSKDNDDVVFATAASTEFGDVLLPNSGDTLNIGMWNGSYHVFEDKQLKELQAAGITKIMGINTLYIGNDTDGDGVISDAEVTSWLDRVYSYGISVIIDLRGWDGTTVPGYVNHPGLIGFLMYDEPCATEFDNLATLKEKFDAVMPEGTLFYVNLFPSCAGGTSLVGSLDWALGRRDYDTYYVQKFLDKLDVEVLSWDNYSLLDGNGIRTDYFYNFELMASKNVPMWYTMLSAGHGTTSASYATPTEDELRWQMAVALTYGVQNIDHYTYVSHESDYSCMVEYETWEPTDLYYDILKVDNEFLAWDNIFMAYDWVGTGAYSANSNNAMLTKLKNALDYTQYGLAGVSANQNLLVGVFDYNGENAYMVTNTGSAGSTTVGDGKNFSMSDAAVTLTLDDADYKCVAVIDNGEISYVAVNADNTVTLTVEAYEGVFVIPVLN